jgi:hypothetical protein
MVHASELEFLRFFYREAKQGMGCAWEDIYDAIKHQFMDNHNCLLPEGYGREEGYL